MRGGDVAILGTGMTDMCRRDLTPESMAYQAVHEALADAELDPGRLGLVLVANATGGRLVDQGCIRGQAWLRKAGLGDVRWSTSTTPVPAVARRCTSGP